MFPFNSPPAPSFPTKNDHWYVNKQHEAAQELNKWSQANMDFHLKIC